MCVSRKCVPSWNSAKAFCGHRSVKVRAAGGFNCLLQHHKELWTMFCHNAVMKREHLCLTGSLSKTLGLADLLWGPKVCFMKCYSAQLDKNAAVVLQGNWLLPHSPPPFSFSWCKMITDSQLMKRGWLKRPAGKGCQTLQTVNLFLFVSSSVHFQLGAGDTQGGGVGGAVCHRVNLKETFAKQVRHSENKKGNTSKV